MARTASRSTRRTQGRAKHSHGSNGYTFFIEDIFLSFNDKQHQLWTTVIQDGKVVDVQSKAMRRKAAPFAADFWQNPGY